MTDTNVQKRLLLVEDDKSIAMGLEYSLTQEGYAVEIRETVADSIAWLKSAECDFAVLDLSLPDGSGYEICRAVRAAGDAAVIILTARSDEDSVVRALEEGADDYVAKGQYWKQQDLRDRALPLDYQPTGLLVTSRKVYVTRQDGSLDVFSRRVLAEAPAATRRTVPEKAETTVNLRTTTGRHGKLQKIYQDPNDAESFWSIDLTNHTLVRLNMYRTSVEIRP